MDFEIMYEVLLRRKNKILMPKSTVGKLSESMFDTILGHKSTYDLVNLDPKYDRLIFSALINLNELGYTLSNEVIEQFLSFKHIESLKYYLSLLIDNLKILTGTNKIYNPMYKNFPEDVMSMDDYTLYFNQIIHYIFNGTAYPIEHFIETEKLPLTDKSKLIILTLGDIKDYEDIFVNMMNSPTSLSNQDKDDLMIFLKDYGSDIVKIIPDKIPFKENMVFILSYVFNNIPYSYEILKKYLKTPVDILRFITSESNGDITFETPTKYKNFTKAQRRCFLSLLENCNNLEEDIKRHKNNWIRVGEILHPSSYQYRYPKVHSAFYLIRNGYRIETFNSKIEELFNKKEFLQTLELLKTRPGEFARRLDFIIRSIDEHDRIHVLNAFKSIAIKVPTTLLMNLKEHFIRRIHDIDKRIVFAKGDVSKVHLVDNHLQALDLDICKNIIKICENAIIANYTSRDLLGTVYIDPNLRNYIVPFSQRSASDMKNIITRGSRINVNPDTKYLRGFIWWTNQEENSDNSIYDKARVDIDLSATLLDSNFNYIDHCSWTKISNKKYNMYHSGDITNGGPVDGSGVAEFLDIDVEELKDKNVSYVMFSIHNFTDQNFSELKNCDFGFMTRENINSGEIFEPKTMVNRMRVNSQTTNITPVIYSVKDNQFIWIDTNILISESRMNVVENILNPASMTLYGIVNMERANMYDIALYNTIARGFQVDNKEDADIIFSSEYISEEEQYLINDVNHPRKVITCYDIDEWYNLL